MITRTEFRLIVSLLCLLIAAFPTLARPITVRTYPQLRDACQSAKPGDVITLAPGIYTIAGASRIAITNRPGPVLVRGAGKLGDVIVQGAGQDDASVAVCFDLTDCPRWTFENLATRRTYSHGFTFNANSPDCVLRHLIMRDHGEGGVKGTSNPEADTHPDRLRIENCDIGFSQRTGSTRDAVEGIDGVAVHNWVVTGCRFVNVQKNGKPAYGVSTKGNASGTLIECCRFENCFIGASFGGGTESAFFRDRDPAYEHRNGSIRNCVFVRCTDAAISLNKARDAKIYANTVFQCGLTIQLRDKETSADVASNLIVLPPGPSQEPAVRVRDGATLLSDHANLITQTFDFARTDGTDHDIDLHLRPGSAALHQGWPLPGDLDTDFDGRRRGLSVTDAGAYEYTTLAARPINP